MKLQLSLLFVAALVIDTFAAPTISTSASASSSAPAPSASLCTPDQLDQRAVVVHPSATNVATLFHGTSAAKADNIVASGIDLTVGVDTGDFSHRPGKHSSFLLLLCLTSGTGVEVAGGFYLTDSVMVAAQFACYGTLNSRPASIDILRACSEYLVFPFITEVSTYAEFGWNPAGAAVYEFPGETTDWTNFQLYNSNPNAAANPASPYYGLAMTIYTNDMITGPLNGPVDTFITDDAWQYAVVKQPVATNNLMYQQRYRGILCKNVPQGNRVNANLYAQGQAGNAGFATRVANLQNPNYSPGNGKFGCTIL
ncbi:hypothetical protein B0H13DRAFT_1886776 [Mycena leptocephala]|nr:hypothetical protein B0H13DRAFT_1886776 [Mycena leptocephala]